MSLVGLLIAVLLLVVVLWLLTLAPLDPRLKLALQVVLVVIVLVWILLSVFGSGPVIRIG